MNQFSRSCAPNRVRELAALAQALITLGSGMLRLSLLTPDSGKSGRCSPPQTRTEPAREKEKKIEFMVLSTNFFFLVLRVRLVSLPPLLLRRISAA
jgi:hypothetical protein